MLNHKFKEGEAVGRIKTDLQDKMLPQGLAGF